MLGVWNCSSSDSLPSASPRMICFFFLDGLLICSDLCVGSCGCFSLAFAFGGCGGVCSSLSGISSSPLLVAGCGAWCVVGCDGPAALVVGGAGGTTCAGGAGAQLVPVV